MRPRVVITHDHRLFVSGLELLLAPEFEVVRTTTDFANSVAAVQDVQPDLLLLGLPKDPSVGLQIISEVRRLVPAAKIVVVTRFNDGALAAEALRRGALAYILKTATESEFLEGVRAALADRVYVSPDLIGTTIQSFVTTEAHGLSVLTDRQVEIVKLLATGLSMKEAAAALNLTPRTVAFHKYAAMRRINAGTSAELIRFALARGLV